LIVEANARSGDHDTTEQALVARAQQGDTEAFGELYALHHDRVAAFIGQRISYHRQLTEDLTAEVFLRAFRKLDSFEWMEKSLRSWLYTIARNIVTDHYRSRTMQRVTYVENLSDVSDYWGLVSPAPDDEIFERFNALQLRAAMAAMTPQQRDVLVLRFLLQRSVSETAAALGLSEGATKTTQYRAMRVLQQNRALRSSYQGEYAA
jgi:RNA polymerase sigma-70 factor (ECF subfamily)